MAVLAGGIAAGIAIERHHLGERDGNAEKASESEKRIAYWVAPMDPNYRRDGPGKSPMGMDLIPVYEGEENATDADAGIVNISGALVQNLGIRTVAAERVDLQPSIRTFGTVAFDETRTSHLHVRREGWIEKLYIRAVGEPVRGDQVVLEMFSPDLAAAAWELVREGSRHSDGLVPVARRKLLALGADPRQVDEISRSGEVPDFIKLYAPRNGVVVGLNAADGMFVQPDMTLLSITDPTSVWLLAEVLEGQAAFVREGMEAEAHVAGLPGRKWRGKVEYIYPDLQPETRTVRLRLSFNNPDLLLKPNMYAAVTLFAPPKKNVVAVPASAVIRTGEGSRVVLSLGDGHFRSVPVNTGVTVGEKTEVLDGVSPGQEVVVSAQFLIDSESSVTAGLRQLEGLSPPRAEPEAWALATVNAAPGAGKVNVTHEPIPALGWPAMTMNFDVGADIPDDLMKPGRTIRIGLAKGKDGLYRIVAAETDRAHNHGDPAARP